MLLVTVSVLRVCLPVKATYFSYVVVVVVVVPHQVRKTAATAAC